MFTIFDLMRPGAGMDAMARQFGLTQDQAQRATEALLPAFMLGLQRSAGNPNAFANLMGATAPWHVAAAGGREPGARPALRPARADAADRRAGRALERRLGAGDAADDADRRRRGDRRPVEVQRGHARPGREPAGRAGNAAATPYAAWADMMRTMLGGSSAAAPTPQAEPAAPPGGSSPVDAWADMIRTMTGQAPVAPEPAPAPAAAASRSPKARRCRRHGPTRSTPAGRRRSSISRRCRTSSTSSGARPPAGADRRAQGSGLVGHAREPVPASLSSCVRRSRRAAARGAARSRQSGEGAAEAQAVEPTGPSRGPCARARAARLRRRRARGRCPSAPGRRGR